MHGKLTRNVISSRTFCILPRDNTTTTHTPTPGPCYPPSGHPSDCGRQTSPEERGKERGGSILYTVFMTTPYHHQYGRLTRVMYLFIILCQGTTYLSRTFLHIADWPTLLSQLTPRSSRDDLVGRGRGGGALWLRVIHNCGFGA